MSRTPLIAGNWKMNLLHDEALTVARGIRERTDGISAVEQLICPPYVFLRDVRDAVAGSKVRVGAQNIYPEEKGAFTGEVSVTQVAEIAEYVIVGHSERRQYFGETDETVNRRVASALAHGLKPVMCVGETLEQRERDETPDVLIRQVRAGLFGIEVRETFVVAYEPVWAIGTGRSADAETAQIAIDLIRRTLRELYESRADDIRVLYGGSVTPENTAELLAQPDIDGGLVGGASLKVESFSAIIEAAAAVCA